VKLLVASDLHFEFHADHGASMVQSLAPADVLVCAGDLSSSSRLEEALNLLCQRYAHVVYVPGNHEFYGSSIPAVRERLRALADRLAGLHYLDNSTCEIDGRKFVGSTMWFRKMAGIERHHNAMNDFHLIRNSGRDIYEENERSLLFLEQHVTAESIVVTHHLPSPKSVAPRWAGSSINCFFVCNVQPLIEAAQPSLWVHGHTHDSADYTIGSTRVVCNPFGYAGREVNPKFTEHKLIEV
jgi:Icc-related predicted phosphoesterase